MPVCFCNLWFCLKALNAEQGYHIKVEGNAAGSIGADDRFTVFRVEPCVSSSG
jgi:hypothetical protein